MYTTSNFGDKVNFMKLRMELIPSSSPFFQSWKNHRKHTNYHRHKFLYGRTGSRYTGKELDAETGLYYYGARYLDPRVSRWLSGDPAMGEYIPLAPVNDQARRYNQRLPGLGGVFNIINMHVYHYAGNNPIRYYDPDGKSDEFANMSAQGQLNYLRNQLASTRFMTDTQKVALASDLRGLREHMKTEDLFNLDEGFMNIGLRNFLNLKEDGTMNYHFHEMTPENGWTEYGSFNSSFHQTEAGQYLNAKFVHTDGREVVFNSNRNIVNTYPDKGTFNYFSSSDSANHTRYDVIPYFTHMRNLGINYRPRFYLNSPNNTNSSHWP